MVLGFSTLLLLVLLRDDEEEDPDFDVFDVLTAFSLASFASLFSFFAAALRAARLGGGSSFVFSSAPASAATAASFSLAFWARV